MICTTKEVQEEGVMYDVAAEQDAQETRGYRDALNGAPKGDSDKACGSYRLGAHYALGFHRGEKERTGAEVPPEVLRKVLDLPPLLRMQFSFCVFPACGSHQKEIRETVVVTVETDKYEEPSLSKGSALARKRSLGARVRLEAFGFEGDGMSSVNEEALSTDEERR